MAGERRRLRWRSKVALAIAKASSRDQATPGFGGGQIETRGPRIRGRRTRLLGVLPDAGGVIADPRMSLAMRIRNGLDPRRAPGLVIVTDAAGRVIATVDPVTRKRTPTH